MNVIRENVDALNAILKVQVDPADYQEIVKSQLDKYRKTAKIPGFRPGHVPFGLIQKQYGRSVLAETLNQVVNDSLNNYIRDEKLDILGNPIPKKDAEVEGNFENPDTFSFEFEIGLSPKLSVDLSSKSKFDYYKVKIDADLIDKQVDDLRRRYGKISSADKVEEKDMILAQFVELNEDETIKEGGILHSSTVSMEFVTDKDTKKALLNAKLGDKTVVNPENVSRGGNDTAAMLGIKPEELGAISKKFQLQVTEVKRMELAELNQELFDKLFGEGNVTSEKELRERISNDLSGMFSTDSDRLLTRSVYDSLLEKTEVSLPDEFLKRWIMLSNEKPITEEQLEKEYDGYAKGLKWQLIQNDIFRSNDIKFDQNEVIEFTKGLVANNFAQYGMPAPEDKELTETAHRVLSNRDEANRIYDMLTENKLTMFFKNTVKLNEKEVSYDDFVAMAQG